MDERIEKYFNEELSSAERLQLLRDVDSDETLKKQFAACQNAYALLNLSDRLENRNIGKRKYDRFVHQKRLRTFRRRWLNRIGYAAATLILAVSSGLLTYRYFRDRSPGPAASEVNTLYTPAGQRACLVLHDGTEVWLNAKSKLVYPARFAGKERRVSVEGEAFFDVASDPSCPFVVSAGEVRMKVMGTQFNVYNYPEAGYVLTSLVEGSLRVYFRAKEKDGVLLEPRQQVTATGGRMVVSPIASNDRFLWRDGIYAFQNEPLTGILKKLELYYDVRIIVNDTSLFQETYTGKFRQRDSLDDIFRILQNIRKFTVRKNADNTVITLSK